MHYIKLNKQSGSEMSGLKEFHATFAVLALKSMLCIQAKLTDHTDK